MSLFLKELLIVLKKLLIVFANKNKRRFLTILGLDGS
jgi:hypothetical protein